MTVKRIDDLKTSIGKIIREAGKDAVLVKSSRNQEFAVLPVDDEVLDLLLERSPRLMRECAQARKEIREGKFHTLEQVMETFKEDFRRYGRARAKKRSAKSVKEDLKRYGKAKQKGSRRSR